MTREELSEALGLNPNYLKYHWHQAQERYEKRGILLYKVGWGDKAVYGVEFPWTDDICWDTDAIEYPY